MCVRTCVSLRESVCVFMLECVFVSVRACACVYVCVYMTVLMSKLTLATN